mgnify:CR=1 FL=1
MRHILTILVDNEPGVLARISGLFTARGFNIESLCVAPTENSSLSKITLVTSGEDWVIDQIVKRFENMINVIKVTDFTDTNSIQRELVIAKVTSNKSKQSAVSKSASYYKSNILEVGEKSLTLEFSGSKEQVDEFLEKLKPLGLKEVTRTGLISLPREKK